MTFPIKRNDRKPDYAAKLEAGCQPIDLTDCTVKFRMTLAPAEGESPHAVPTPKVFAPAVIDDAVGGLVHYEWGVGDTDTAGYYRAEWVITYPGDLPRTVPSEDFSYIQINPRADEAQ